MKTIEIKCRLTGDVLFSHTCEGNTIQITIKEANLHDANLRDSDLSGANLSGANLRDSDLRDSDLHDANLSGANLRYANLSGANLRDSNLHDANLSGADLSGANLSGANLRYANLSGANLHGANLHDANLHDANLRDSDLSDSDLSDSDLSDSDLSGANLTHLAIPKIDNIHKKVLEVCCINGNLNMSTWYSSCGTTHCIAGHVELLAGDDGKELAKRTSVATAAYLIYNKSSDIKIPKGLFYLSTNNSALEQLEKLAEQENNLNK